MLFDRVKSLDAILATAEKKGLHRSLGAFQLTMLGVGAVIGTGIFVLTAVAAQKAGPGMMLSFCIAGFVCAVAALCYSELASMVPVEISFVQPRKKPTTPNRIVKIHSTLDNCIMGFSGDSLDGDRTG